MIFCLYTDHGALNSKPVFEAFAKSLVDAGHSVMYNEPYRVFDHYSNYDIAVIWSVLWQGRMDKKQNSVGTKRFKQPVIVLEVGGINRGTTWKVGLNGINRTAYFGEQNNDGIVLVTWDWFVSLGDPTGNFILVCGQHDQSLQWQGMPSMSNWVTRTIDDITNTY